MAIHFEIIKQLYQYFFHKQKPIKMSPQVIATLDAENNREPEEEVGGDSNTSLKNCFIFCQGAN